MSALRTVSVVFLLIALMLGLSSIYTVHQGQHGLLLRLGKLVQDSDGRPKVFDPGLHFKIPIINLPRLFDTRLQTLDAKTELITTVNKKDVKVDYYVKWRVADLATYYLRNNGSQMNAERLLEQKINGSLREEFGKRSISEVVSDDRSEVMKLIQDDVAKRAKDIGIEVTDVRIKRIDLPDAVSNSIYAQMRAERREVANQHRADGRAIAEKIRADSDRQATVTVAEARRQSQQLRGEGDAEAAKTYADAYNVNKEFFAFYRSLEAYKKAFASKKDFLVLQPDGDFFKYFNHSHSEQAKAG